MRALITSERLPPKYSKKAPPAVDVALICFVYPDWFKQFSVSPPPAMVKASDSARAFANVKLPFWKGGVSNAPIGPAQMMVFAFLITFFHVSSVFDPISSAISVEAISSTGFC